MSLIDTQYRHINPGQNQTERPVIKHTTPLMWPAARTQGPRSTREG